MSKSGAKATDTPEGIAFFKSLESLKKREVNIGFYAGEAAYKSGLDVCENAAMQEYGTSKIPSRPFMRDTADNPLLGDLAETTKIKILSSEDADSILEYLGSNIEMLVKDKIMEYDIFETGLLYDSVTHKVTDKGDHE